MYLLDTNVVSELRKASANKADANVVNWAKAISATEMYISVITVMELELGILLVERKDVRQAKALREWLNKKVIPSFINRIIPFDVPEALCCASLHSPNPKSERDAMIAATASVHNMTVVTRNINDFKEAGVNLINPWDKVLP